MVRPKAVYKGWGGNAFVFDPLRIGPIAAPAVLPGGSGHLGAHRIEFNIAHAGEQIRLIVD